MDDFGVELADVEKFRGTPVLGNLIQSFYELQHYGSARPYVNELIFEEYIAGTFSVPLDLSRGGIQRATFVPENTAPIIRVENLNFSGHSSTDEGWVNFRSLLLGPRVYSHGVEP